MQRTTSLQELKRWQPDIYVVSMCNCLFLWCFPQERSEAPDCCFVCFAGKHMIIKADWPLCDAANTLLSFLLSVSKHPCVTLQSVMLCFSEQQRKVTSQRYRWQVTGDRCCNGAKLRWLWGLNSVRRHKHATNSENIRLTQHTCFWGDNKLTDQAKG